MSLCLQTMPLHAYMCMKKVKMFELLPALFVMDLSSISIADEPATAKKVKSIEYERDVSF